MVEIINGVPQGSVLRPLLLLVCINGIILKISKVADGTKLCGESANETDVKIFQDDLIRLSHWSEDWQILFTLHSLIKALANDTPNPIPSQI